MWLILEHRRARRQLESLPLAVQERYQQWKSVIEQSGPHTLRSLRGLRDKALGGEWKGHRSSRLGIHHRVIYRVVKDRVLVEVVNVTAHDYRRK